MRNLPIAIFICLLLSLKTSGALATFIFKPYSSLIVTNKQQRIQFNLSAKKKVLLVMEREGSNRNLFTKIRVNVDAKRRFTLLSKDKNYLTSELELNAGTHFVELDVQAVEDGFGFVSLLEQKPILKHHSAQSGAASTIQFELGQISIQKHSFDASTDVQISAEVSSEVDEDFKIARDMLPNLGPRFPLAFFIRTGIRAPKKNLTWTWKISSEFLSALGSQYDPKLMVQMYMDGGQETLDQFHAYFGDFDRRFRSKPTGCRSVATLAD